MDWQTILFQIFVEFLIQISGWAEEFRAEGICCIWLAQKPVVGLFNAEYVEVECMRINCNDTVITPNTRWLYIICIQFLSDLI
jgi:hypothetical protein